MPIPFPYDAIAGSVNDPAERLMMAAYDNFKWVARLIDEMNAEEEQDLKRTFQVIMHSRRFRSQWLELRQYPTDEVLPVIKGFFMMKGVEWKDDQQMLTDLDEVTNDIYELADWLETNTPEYKDGFTTVKIVAISAEGEATTTDEALKAAKPQELADKLTTIRGKFEAKDTKEAEAIKLSR